MLQMVVAVTPAVGEIRTTNAQGGEQRTTARAPGVYARPDDEREHGGLWIHTDGEAVEAA